MVRYVREDKESGEGRIQRSLGVTTLQYRRWREETETKREIKTETKVHSELIRGWDDDKTENCEGGSTCGSNLFGWDEGKKAHTLSDVNEEILKVVHLM